MAQSWKLLDVCTSGLEQSGSWHTRRETLELLLEWSQLLLQTVRFVAVLEGEKFSIFFVLGSCLRKGFSLIYRGC